MPRLFQNNLVLELRAHKVKQGLCSVLRKTEYVFKSAQEIVRAAIRNIQITGSVIQLATIFMVDYFIRSKWSAKFFSHNKAVLSDRCTAAPATSELEISRWSNGSFSIGPAFTDSGVAVVLPPFIMHHAPAPCYRIAIASSDRANKRSWYQSVLSHRLVMPTAKSELRRSCNVATILDFARNGVPLHPSFFVVLATQSFCMNSMAALRRLAGFCYRYHIGIIAYTGTQVNA